MPIIDPAFFYYETPQDECKFIKFKNTLKTCFSYAPFTIRKKPENVVNVTRAHGFQGVYTTDLSECVCITLLQKEGSGAPKRISMFHSPGGLLGWVSNDSSDTIGNQIAERLLAGFDPKEPLFVLITNGTSNLKQYLPKDRSNKIIQALNIAGYNQVEVENIYAEYVAISFEGQIINSIVAAINDDVEKRATMRP